MADYQNQKLARKVYRGETWTGQFTPPSPVDVSTWTLKAYLYTDPTQDDAAPLLSVDPVVTDGPNGVFQVRLTHAQTLSVPAGNYLLDVWRDDPDDAEEKRLAGVALTFATGGER